MMDFLHDTFQNVLSLLFTELGQVLLKPLEVFWASNDAKAQGPSGAAASLHLQHFSFAPFLGVSLSCPAPLPKFLGARPFKTFLGANPYFG